MTFTTPGEAIPANFDQLPLHVQLLAGFISDVFGWGLTPSKWVQQNQVALSQQPGWAQTFGMLGGLGWLSPFGVGPSYITGAFNTAYRAGWLGVNLGDLYQYQNFIESEMGKAATMRHPETILAHLARAGYGQVQQDMASDVFAMNIVKLGSYFNTRLTPVRALSFPFMATYRGIMSTAGMAFEISLLYHINPSYTQSLISGPNASGYFNALSYQATIPSLISGLVEWTGGQLGVWGIRQGFKATLKASLGLSLVQPSLQLGMEMLTTITLRQMLGMPAFFNNEEEQAYRMQMQISAGLMVAGFGIMAAQELGYFGGPISFASGLNPPTMPRGFLLEPLPQGMALFPPSPLNDILFEPMFGPSLLRPVANPNNVWRYVMSESWFSPTVLDPLAFNEGAFSKYLTNVTSRSQYLKLIKGGTFMPGKGPIVVFPGEGASVVFGKPNVIADLSTLSKGMRPIGAPELTGPYGYVPTITESPFPGTNAPFWVEEFVNSKGVPSVRYLFYDASGKPQIVSFADIGRLTKTGRPFPGTFGDVIVEESYDPQGFAQHRYITSLGEELTFEQVGRRNITMRPFPGTRANVWVKEWNDALGNPKMEFIEGNTGKVLSFAEVGEASMTTRPFPGTQGGFSVYEDYDAMGFPRVRYITDSGEPVTFAQIARATITTAPLEGTPFNIWSEQYYSPRGKPVQQYRWRQPGLGRVISLEQVQTATDIYRGVSTLAGFAGFIAGGLLSDYIYQTFEAPYLASFGQGEAQIGVGRIVFGFSGAVLGGVVFERASQFAMEAKQAAFNRFVQSGAGRVTAIGLGLASGALQAFFVAQAAEMAVKTFDALQKIASATYAMEQLLAGNILGETREIPTGRGSYEFGFVGPSTIMVSREGVVGTMPALGMMEMPTPTTPVLVEGERVVYSTKGVELAAFFGSVTTTREGTPLGKPISYQVPSLGGEAAAIQNAALKDPLTMKAVNLAFIQEAWAPLDPLYRGVDVQRRLSLQTLNAVMEGLFNMQEALGLAYNSLQKVMDASPSSYESWLAFQTFYDVYTDYEAYKWAAISQQIIHQRLAQSEAQIVENFISGLSLAQQMLAWERFGSGREWAPNYGREKYGREWTPNYGREKDPRTREWTPNYGREKDPKILEAWLKMWDIVGEDYSSMDAVAYRTLYEGTGAAVRVPSGADYLAEYANVIAGQIILGWMESLIQGGTLITEPEWTFTMSKLPLSGPLSEYFGGKTNAGALLAFLKSLGLDAYVNTATFELQIRYPNGNIVTVTDLSPGEAGPNKQWAFAPIKVGGTYVAFWGGHGYYYSWNPLTGKWIYDPEGDYIPISPSPGTVLHRGKIITPVPGTILHGGMVISPYPGTVISEYED